MLLERPVGLRPCMRTHQCPLHAHTPAPLACAHTSAPCMRTRKLLHCQSLPTTMPKPWCAPALPSGAGGIDWSYHRFGNSSAGRPPLAMIHGLGGTQYDWPMQVRSVGKW